MDIGIEIKSTPGVRLYLCRITYYVCLTIIFLNICLCFKNVINGNFLRSIVAILISTIKNLSKSLQLIETTNFQTDSLSIDFVQ